MRSNILFVILFLLLTCVKPGYAMSNLDAGFSAIDQGKYAQGIEFLEKHVRKSEFDKNKNIDYASAVGMIGYGHLMLENLDQAETYLRKALFVFDSLATKNNDSYTENLSNLTQVLTKKEDFEEAEFYNRKLIAQNIENLGEDHPSVALNYNNLALVLSH